MLIGSMFSGIGGLDLAAEWLTGGQTIWQLDREEKAPEFGDCHRYPPASPGGKYEFPVLPRWEWCGEFVEEKKR